MRPAVYRNRPADRVPRPRPRGGTALCAKVNATEMSNVDYKQRSNVSKNDFSDFLSRIDMGAIADPGDKVRECEFFLGLASAEPDQIRFRWLISAFLNAVYSYFETNALYANLAITTEEGDQIADDEAVAKLRAYVEVTTRNTKKGLRVDTSALDPVLKRLYEIRAAATHHFPLSIMATGSNLPEDFHFGSMRGEGEPVMKLCRDALEVVKQAERDLLS